MSSKIKISTDGVTKRVMNDNKKSKKNVNVKRSEIQLWHIVRIKQKSNNL